MGARSAGALEQQARGRAGCRGQRGGERVDAVVAEHGAAAHARHARPRRARHAPARRVHAAELQARAQGSIL